MLLAPARQRGDDQGAVVPATPTGRLAVPGLRRHQQCKGGGGVDLDRAGAEIYVTIAYGLELGASAGDPLLAQS